MGYVAQCPHYVVLGITKPVGVGCGNSRLHGSDLYDIRIVFVVASGLHVHHQWTCNKLQEVSLTALTFWSLYNILKLYTEEANTQSPLGINLNGREKIRQTPKLITDLLEPPKLGNQ